MIAYVHMATAETQFQEQQFFDATSIREVQKAAAASHGTRINDNFPKMIDNI